MKNLLIDLHPSKSFRDYHWGKENEKLVKIQIDNSLSLGWKKNDILLVTNFDYEYRGVKSMVVSDQLFCNMSYTVTKILVITYLFDKKLIEDDLYWFHDFDAFQLEPLTATEIDIGNSTLALTDYGITTINEARNKRWSTGSMFFNNKSQEIFEMIKNKAYQYRVNEEVALLALTRRNRGNILNSMKKLNIRYNFATRKRDIAASYGLAEKPLKVIHFHPSDRRKLDLEPGNNIDVCIYGRNRLNKILINQQLTDLFNKYKII